MHVQHNELGTLPKVMPLPEIWYSAVHEGQVVPLMRYLRLQHLYRRNVGRQLSCALVRRLLGESSTAQKAARKAG